MGEQRGAGALRAGAILLVLLAVVAGLVAASGPARPGAEATGLRALTGGVWAGHDTLTHDYPATWWGWRETRRTGQVPQWNPSWFGGMPFIASQTFMPDYPPNRLGRWLPFPLAFNLQYPLHLLLAGLVMAWTLRRRGLGWSAVLIGALAWGFSSHLGSLIGPGHLQKVQALAWLPLVAYGAGQLGSNKPRRGWLPLTLGLALQLTAGHLQIVYWSLVAGGVEALARIVADPNGPGLRARLGRLGRVIGWGALACGLAVGLAASFMLPTIEFARASNRQGALEWSEATRGSLPPEEAVEFILPRLLGDSMPGGRGVYHGRYGAHEYGGGARIVSDYVGGAVLVLAVLALFGPRRRLAALGWALASVGLVVSLGGYLGLVYKAMLAILPGLAHFRSPSVAMALLVYGMALASASGLDGILAHGMSRRTRHGLFAATGLLLLVALAAGVALMIGRIAPDHLAVTLLGAATHATLAGALSCALLLVAVLAGPRLFHAPVRRIVVMGLVLVLAFDLGLNLRPFWNAEDIAPYRAFLTRHGVLADAADAARPLRYLEPGNELSNRALTLTDYEAGRVVSNIQGYHPVVDARAFELTERLGLTHPNLLAAYAVNRLLWPETQPPPEGWYSLGLAGGRHVLVHPHHEYVRRIAVLESYPDRAAMLDALTDPERDMTSVAAIVDDAVDRMTPLSVGKRLSRLRTRQLGPGRVEIQAESDAPGWLVLSEPAYPGWRVWLERDGVFEEVPWIETDGFFIGIPTPVGRFSILAEYDPASRRVGSGVSLVALLAVAAIALALRKRRCPT